MSAPKNFAYDFGATFTITVSVNDEAAPMDLTGYVCHFKVGNKKYAFTPVGDTISIVVSDDETGRWLEKQNYLLDIESPTGEVTRLLYGSLNARSGFHG